MKEQELELKIREEYIVGYIYKTKSAWNHLASNKTWEILALQSEFYMHYPKLFLQAWKADIEVKEKRKHKEECERKEGIREREREKEGNNWVAE